MSNYQKAQQLFTEEPVDNNELFDEVVQELRESNKSATKKIIKSHLLLAKHKTQKIAKLDEEIGWHIEDAKNIKVQNYDNVLYSGFIQNCRHILFKCSFIFLMCFLLLIYLLVMLSVVLPPIVSICIITGLVSIVVVGLLIWGVFKISDYNCGVVRRNQAKYEYK